MKKASKIMSIVLSLVLVLSCFVSLVACKDKDDDSAKNAIEMYILPEDGTLVDADFTLPKTIGATDKLVDVTWTSDNKAITIEDDGNAYKAKVTLQSEVTEVKLTISAGKASKSFVVRVDELSIYTFIDRYKFPQKLTAVTQDFDLDQSFTVQDKTASITWSVEDEDSKDYIQVQGNKCVVNLPDDDLKSVKLHAVFSCPELGEESTTFVDYDFSVSPPYDHQQLVNRRFSIQGDPLELSGYIVYINEASASYGNATFWMIDDDFCSGYYLYRVKIDSDQIDKVVPGAHVTISGDTTKNFNGLWENNSGGTAVIDDAEPIDINEHIYDFDTDLLSDAPSALWRQSTMVKLSGWKVKSLPTKPTGSDQNLVTLTRGDKDIVVRLSKYVFTESRTDKLNETIAVWDALSAAKAQGDVYVDVVGLLGYYNGYQLQPVDASGIKIVKSEGTNTQAVAIKTAFELVNTAVETNFADTIVGSKTVTMPISSGDVKISYNVCGIKEGTGTVTIDGGTFTINPINELKNYEIKVTYTLGNYKAYTFFKLPNQALDDEGIVNAVKELLSLATVSFEWDASITLPTNADDLGYTSVTISWAVRNAEQAAWLQIDGSKLVVTQPAEASSATLVATIEKGEESTTKEFTITVTALDASKLTLTAANLGMDSGYNTTEATGVLRGVTFGWVQSMRNTYDGRDAIQFSGSKGTVFYTKTALPKAIKEIHLVFDGNNGYKNDNVFTISFATSYDGLATAPAAQQVVFNTEANQNEYTVTAPAGEWTFVHFKAVDTHASYWAKIEIVFVD